jgi:hypothetical protein
MKEYCSKCGYGNEYTSTKPTKCTKCGSSFGAIFILKTQHTKNDNTEKEIIAVIDHDPEFPDSTPPDVEPISREELDEIKASASSQSFNLRDILQANAANTTNKPKRKKARKK